LNWQYPAFNAVLNYTQIFLDFSRNWPSPVIRLRSLAVDISGIAKTEVLNNSGERNIADLN